MLSQLPFPSLLPMSVFSLWRPSSSLDPLLAQLPHSQSRLDLARATKKILQNRQTTAAGKLECGSLSSTTLLG